MNQTVSTTEEYDLMDSEMTAVQVSGDVIVAAPAVAETLMRIGRDLQNSAYEVQQSQICVTHIFSHNAWLQQRLTDCEVALTHERILSQKATACNQQTERVLDFLIKGHGLPEGLREKILTLLERNNAQEIAKMTRDDELQTQFNQYMAENQQLVQNLQSSVKSQQDYIVELESRVKILSLPSIKSENRTQSSDTAIQTKLHEDYITELQKLVAQSSRNSGRTKASQRGRRMIASPRTPKAWSSQPARALGSTSNPTLELNESLCHVQPVAKVVDNDAKMVGMKAEA